MALYASMGMTPEEIKRRVEAESGPLGIWPENWPAVQVFQAAITQWRHGMNGPTGLDYTVIPMLFDLIGIAENDRNSVFTKVRMMEIDAINLLAEKRKNRT